MQRRILIIDDDEDDRALFIDAVKEIDGSSECISAQGGVEAILWLDTCEQLPDLIFLDLNMPRLSGREFLIKIKKEPRLSQIPVIIYSTSKRNEDIDDTKSLGAVYFLTKPVLFRDICSSLVSVLNKTW